MSDSQNIFGCFVSSHAPLRDTFQIDPSEPGERFSQFVWSENGICDVLKTLNSKKYGRDLQLVLFQFYVNPMPERREQLKEIESYRRNERAIGIPIIVTNENFFDCGEDEKKRNICQIILKKIDLLSEMITRRKLDTDIQSLRADLTGVLSQYLG